MTGDKHGDLTAAQVLLLVEDNPGDAYLVQTLLDDGSSASDYQIVHASCMADALEQLRSRPVDVVLLDLRLPDVAGIDTVHSVRSVASEVPIVVLTGTDDEQLALDCIHASAQDYLNKSELRPLTLRRAIGYAVTRQRETQLRELRESLTHMRKLSSAASGTTTTAALVGSGAVSLRHPKLFSELVAQYLLVLVPHVDALPRTQVIRAHKERIITSLGDSAGGPRDLLDVHVTALDHLVNARSGAGLLSVAFEARLLALEMMGLLVDYYRVGMRRRSQEGIS